MALFLAVFPLLSAGIRFATAVRMSIIPVQFFLTKGVGMHQKEVRIYENALRDAGTQTCNLIKTLSVIRRAAGASPSKEE